MSHLNHFQKQSSKFFIKYAQKNNKSLPINPIQQEMCQVPKLQYKNGRKRTKIQSQPRQNYLSLDATQLSTDRYNRKSHILSEDSEVVIDRNRSNKRKSVSFRQKSNLGGSLQKSFEYKRIPIQSSNETDSAGVNGRIIYKGYCPKNSYYLMNNLKQIPETTLEQSARNSYETDLQFNSKFESGNLGVVSKISKTNYWLFMREDTNTKGLRQWFYFQVVCNRPLKVTFRIYRFSKRYSLYKHGMKPYIRQNQGEWMQKGETVRYEYDQVQKCYYLQFVYQFQRERHRILVAGMPPYGYSKLTRFIDGLSMNPYIKIKSIGSSLGGVDIPLIQISGNREERHNDQKNVKRAIVILGRIHPAETCSNFSIEAIVQRIVSCVELLGCFDFYIVPMVNPDGVIVGNHRTGLAGVDLNRKYQFGLSNRELFPEVEAVKMFVRNKLSSQNIQFLIDLHGHSAKRNIFAYGEEQLVQSERYLKGRIIPKLLSQKLSSFRYGFCEFQSYKQKQHTARVYFGRKYNINTLTFEQSYGLIGKKLIGIGDWRQFGYTLVEVLIEYQRSYMNSTQKMTLNLKQQIQKEKSRKTVEIQHKKVELQNEQKIESIGQQVEGIESNIQQNIFDEMVDQYGQNDENQSLSSGDQQLQNDESGLQELHKRVFIKNATINRRVSYVMPDTTIGLQEQRQERNEIVHEMKMPVVARILRMKQKRKISTDLVNLLTQNGREHREVSRKIQSLEIRLPNINKYLL